MVDLMCTVLLPVVQRWSVLSVQHKLQTHSEEVEAGTPTRHCSNLEQWIEIDLSSHPSVVRYHSLVLPQDEDNHGLMDEGLECMLKMVPTKGDGDSSLETESQMHLRNIPTSLKKVDDRCDCLSHGHRTRG